MKALWYSGPSGGETVANPTADEMVERLRRGSTYWGQFGPHGMLKWYEHPTSDVPADCGYEGDVHLQQLIFIRHPERGWFFEFSSSPPLTDRWLFPFDPAADRDDYFPQWAGGDSQMFLAGCFVPQATAERVVRDFMADGEPSPAVQWFSDILARMDEDDLERHRQKR